MLNENFNIILKIKISLKKFNVGGIEMFINKEININQIINF